MLTITMCFRPKVLKSAPLSVCVRVNVCGILNLDTWESHYICKEKKTENSWPKGSCMIQYKFRIQSEDVVLLLFFNLGANDTMCEKLRETLYWSTSGIIEGKGRSIIEGRESGYFHFSPSFRIFVSLYFIMLNLTTEKILLYLMWNDITLQAAYAVFHLSKRCK